MASPLWPVLGCGRRLENLGACGVERAALRIEEDEVWRSRTAGVAQAGDVGVRRPIVNLAAVGWKCNDFLLQPRPKMSRAWSRLPLMSSAIGKGLERRSLCLLMHCYTLSPCKNNSERKAKGARWRCPRSGNLWLQGESCDTSADLCF